MSIWGRRVDGWVDSHKPRVRTTHNDLLGLALVVLVIVVVALVAGLD
jgi:hypothetical protein